MMKGRTRTQPVLIYLSEKESALLCAQAELSGLSKSAVVRNLIKGNHMKPRPQMDVSKIIYELSKIGNNLNQLAHQANRYGVIDSENYLLNVKWIEEELLRLKEEFYGDV